MKWLPATLFLVGAFCFFIVAALRESAGALVVMGCVFLVLGIILLKRARTAP